MNGRKGREGEKETEKRRWGLIAAGGWLADGGSKKKEIKKWAIGPLFMQRENIEGWTRDEEEQIRVYNPVTMLVGSQPADCSKGNRENE